MNQRFLTFFGYVWLAQCLAWTDPQQMPQPHFAEDIVQYPEDYCMTNITNNESFDFIVVGAGPGGATVARRLAEIPSFRVLLLEAGGDPPAATDIPGSQTPPPPDSLWMYRSIPNDRQCLGKIGSRCTYHTGKFLGGSSVINGMMYVRGNREDFNEWEALGNPGWGYKDVLYYFRKLENDVPRPRARIENTRRATYHNAGGPLTASHWPLDPLTKPFRESYFEAIKNHGFRRNYDVNGESQMGFGSTQGMIEPQGYRDNIAKAYLLHIPDNLKVCKKASVSKVKVSSKKVVNSLDFDYSGLGITKTFTVKANKEIILSAGALNSPMILERSGIGRKDVLNRAGVKMIHNLEGVGENLQEQLINMGISFTVDLKTHVTPNPLTNGLSSLAGFLNLTVPSSDVPDIQIIHGTWSDQIGVAYAFKPQIALQYKAATAKSDMILIGSVVLRPPNPGFIHITSPDPDSSPSFDPNQFSSSYEKDLTVKAARLVRSIMKSPELAKYNPKPFRINECKMYKYNSAEEILCQSQKLASAAYHLVGSTSMGPKSNKMAVVDPRLRVHGIQGLRVVDAGIMPLVTRGNTETPTVMVAEKAADMIKEDYGEGYE